MKIISDFGLNLNGVFKKLICFDTIDSTSLYAKSLVKHDDCDGTIIISKTQTLGRGRVGRAWTSPEGGIWFSFIVCPNIIYYEYFSIITLLVGVSVAKAISETCNVKCNLKWPNDILVDNKKICGILVENVHSQNTNTVIVGIGINSNVNVNSFPQDIKLKATSLSNYLGRDIDNSNLIQAILDNFNYYYPYFCNQYYDYIVDSWCEYSDIIGKEIMYTNNNQNKIGKVFKVSNKGELAVIDNDGEIQMIKSGEVSIRNIDGGYY